MTPTIQTGNANVAQGGAAAAPVNTLLSVVSPAAPAAKTSPAVDFKTLVASCSVAVNGGQSNASSGKAIPPTAEHAAAKTSAPSSSDSAEGQKYAAPDESAVAVLLAAPIVPAPGQGPSPQLPTKSDPEEQSNDASGMVARVSSAISLEKNSCGFQSAIRGSIETGGAKAEPDVHANASVVSTVLPTSTNAASDVTEGALQPNVRETASNAAAPPELMTQTNPPSCSAQPPVPTQGQSSLKDGTGSPPVFRVSTVKVPTTEVHGQDAQPNTDRSPEELKPSPNVLDAPALTAAQQTTSRQNPATKPVAVIDQPQAVLSNAAQQQDASSSMVAALPQSSEPQSGQETVANVPPVVPPDPALINALVSPAASAAMTSLAGAASVSQGASKITGAQPTSSAAATGPSSFRAVKAGNQKLSSTASAPLSSASFIPNVVPKKDLGHAEPQGKASESKSEAKIVKPESAANQTADPAELSQGAHQDLSSTQKLNAGPNESAAATAVGASSSSRGTPAKASDNTQATQGIPANPDSDDTMPTQLPSLVSTAKLVQGLNQSEFRIGLQTRELGNIDIHTSMAAHTFTAQIFVEHGEAARTLSAELPGLYSRLADQQVLTGPIQIHGDGLSTLAGFDQNRGQESARSYEPNQKPGGFEPDIKAPVPIFETVAASDRLDVRI